MRAYDWWYVWRQCKVVANPGANVPFARFSPAQTKRTTSPPWLASAVLACGERKTDARVIRGM